MKEMNELIEKHGGWPGAFVTKQNKESAPPETKSTRPVFGTPRPEQVKLPLAAEPKRDYSNE